MNKKKLNNLINEAMKNLKDDLQEDPENYDALIFILEDIGRNKGLNEQDFDRLVSEAYEESYKLGLIERD